jgi:dTDP-glucose 4,6-dehydratase
MKNKTILITGGAGFIGSNFVNYLLKQKSGHKIIVLDALTYAGNLGNFSQDLTNNSNFEFIYGNIRNTPLVQRIIKKVDIIVHLAAETHVARSISENIAFFETDVLGTHALANAAVNSEVERFIHISTSEVYGSAESDIMDENHPLNPTTPYASAKAGADRLVYSYFKTYDLPGLILRPFNNYGPFQHLEKVIPHFISNLIIGDPLSIHGDGKSTRDWLYVGDHCKAIEKSLYLNLDDHNHEVINVGTQQEYSIIEIAKKLLKMFQKSDESLKFLPDRPGQVKRHISSIEKSKRILNWKAETSFEDGLSKTVQWYKENRDWWKNMLWLKKCNEEVVQPRD